ncbi:MAG: sensor histidine kinase [Chloroflexota bacterium]
MLPAGADAAGYGRPDAVPPGRPDDRGVAHDLRTLVAAIAAHAELARMDLPDGHPARAELDALLVLAARARTLALGWLTGPMAMAAAPAAVPLDALVHAALPVVRAAAGAGVALTLELAAPIPVRADPVAIERILVNLVTNAAVAAGGAGPVRVATALLADGGGSLTVADRGPGLPAGARATLAGEGSAGADAAGHGLGLATVRALADGCGATIIVTETPGGGATIELRLPPA